MPSSRSGALDRGGPLFGSGDMWDDRFIFVLSALFGISLWIVISKRRAAIRTGRPPWFAYGLLTSIVAAIAIILTIRYFGHVTEPEGLQYPGLGLVVALIIGGAVGRFSARFLWTLFSARFGAKDPLIGVLVLLLLVIVYSLPVYQREISALLSHVGLSSLKTPIGELTFTEHSRFQGAVVSAAKPSGDERSSALPRPSYPRPGLDSLRHAVSGGPNDYLIKDARYIAFFDGRDDVRPDEDPAQPVIVATRTFPRPRKTLARSLRAYGRYHTGFAIIAARRQTRPVLLFPNACECVAARQNSTDPTDRPKNAAADLNDFYKLVDKVRGDVLGAIGATRAASDGADQSAFVEADDGRNPDFAEKCRGDNLKPGAEAARELEAFTYLQPYVTIALANLLVAHGSSDEAIDVITQWLYQWRCARGEDTDRKERAAKCKFGPLAVASRLPEWFRIRAEFELNVLLYGQAGEENITYRDFLRDHAAHFADYAAHPHKDDRRESPAAKVQGSGGISIREELTRCQDRKPPTDGSAALGPDIRAIMLRSLLQNENTLLRSEIHF